MKSFSLFFALLGLFLTACAADHEVQSQDWGKGNPPMSTARSDEGLFDSDGGPPTGWSSGGDLIAKVSTDWANDPSRVGLAAVFPEPGVYTVNISAAFSTDPGAPVRTLALVEWSVGGNTVSRLVSVGQSTSISAPAEGVKVSVYDDSYTFPLTSGQPAIHYSINISVTKGVRPGINRPLLAAKESFGEVFPIPAVQLTYKIPPASGAIAVGVLIASAGATPYPIIPDNMIQLAQVSRGNTVAVCDPRQMEFIPLDPTATDLLIQNTGTFPVYVTLYYAIDG